MLTLSLCMGATTMRLKVLLAALPKAQHIPLSRLYLIFLTSSAAQILLPSPAAEILRTVHLSRRYGHRLEDVTSAHVVEKAVDAIALSAFVLLLLGIGQMPPWMVRPISAFILFSLVGVALVVAFARRSSTLVNPSFTARPPAWERIVQFLNQTVASLRRFRSSSAWIAATGWSCLAEATNALTVGLVLEAVDQPAAIGAWLAVVLAARVSGAVPLTPGQIGVQEGSVVLVLGAFGIEPSRAMAAALLYRAVHSLPVIILGGLALRSLTSAPARSLDRAPH